MLPFYTLLVAFLFFIFLFFDDSGSKECLCDFIAKRMYLYMKTVSEFAPPTQVCMAR
jgi:hypothetical protein